MRISPSGGLAEALSSIAERFPTAAKIEIADPRTRHDLTRFWKLDSFDEQLAACLAALPNGCWPAAREFCYSDISLPVPVAIHVARLCPRLRRVSFERGSHNSAALCAAAFEGLAAAAGTLESLDFQSREDPPANDGDSSCGPTSTQRMAAALARLSSLHHLKFVWDHQEPASFEGAEVLAGAMPSLTALTSLKIEGPMAEAVRPQLAQLAAWPEALRELTIYSHGPWAADMLAAAPHLGGITKLAMVE